MADQPIDKPEATAPGADAQEASAPEAKPAEPELAAKEDDKPEPGVEPVKEEAKAPEEPEEAESSEKPAAEDATDKPAEDVEKKPEDDAEMKDATETATGGEDPSAAAAADETPAAKSKARRKSSAGESKGKTLSKKASKARLTHTNAKPGDHFLVKLKGFPAWPAIICDETMLPEALINSRPNSAAKPDGTYVEAYADGGKRVNDRNFPVMYLYTNEFGWAHNASLTELTPEKAQESITTKMRKDLKAAFELAAEHNSIDHYKEMLQQILQDMIAQEKARRESAATPKKSKKGKGKAEEDEDVDMADAGEEAKPSKSKKRKADDDTSTPQRTDSAKKTKIKINLSSTPKTANGAGTPKSKSDSTAKSSKTKPKKAKDGGDKKADTPKEVKMSPEERRARKEKEVLYLRHKLQRGLLTRDQQPQESEMKQMSEFITMLENFAELEVSIIRTTKINKVLKAILKLDSIPREEEFQFKKRSQALLDNWNKLMAGDGASSSAPNGVNGTSDAAEKKTEPNGVKESVEDAKTETPKPAETAMGEGATEEKSEDAKEKSDTGNEEGEKVPSETPAAAAAPEGVETSA